MFFLMETLAKIIPYLEIIVSLLIVLAVLLQRSGLDAGGALGTSEGGIYHKRRGMEKGLFWLTIILAIILAMLVIVARFI